MSQSTQKLSIIAYYLSKYDRKGVCALGYKTQQKALDELSALYGHANAYLKMRRDEFDVVTGSHRKGFCNRKPAISVIHLAELLDLYSFEELSQLVTDMIKQKRDELAGITTNLSSQEFEETTIEDIMNGYNSTARLVEITNPHYQRIYHHQSLEKLKKHYGYCCQICGINAGNEYGIELAEVHHIIPFSVSQDNSLTNLVVLCPNHHRLLHKVAATFDAENTCFILPDRKQLSLVLNHHL